MSLKMYVIGVFLVRQKKAYNYYAKDCYVISHINYQNNEKCAPQAFTCHCEFMTIEINPLIIKQWLCLEEK